MAEMVATRDVYGKTLIELGRENPDVVVLDADCSQSTRTAWFREKYPKRFFNLGVAEANMIGVAAGLALCGKIPFASTFAIFATARAFEQIRNCICWPKANVKIVATHAGISVGEDGASHQAVEDITIMRMFPNMTVIVPADGIETAKTIHWAASFHGPVYIRLGRAKFPLIFDEDYRFTPGVASTLFEGRDATIIACGLMVSESITAREMLIQEGIEVGIINMSTIKPIDRDAIIRASRATGAIITCEEHTIIGGLGSAVTEVLTEECPVVVKRVGMQDQFGVSGSPRDLLKHFKMSAEYIVQAVREVIGRKKRQ
ncbi:TPA: transketolase [bacterium]|nr:transketolase [bacterium]